MSDRNERGEFLPNDGSKRRSISTRLTDDEYQRFKDACVADGEAPTVLLRSLILDWMDSRESRHLASESDRPRRGKARSAAKSPKNPKDKAEFQTGQMVKNPAGWRGWITKLLDNGKAVVDWEGQVNGDVIPLHLLRVGE